MKWNTQWLIALVVRLAVGLLLAALLLVEVFGLSPPETVAACRALLAALPRQFGW